MNRINEDKIVKLVRDYQKDRENQIMIEIIQQTSQMIYNYPKIVFHRNEDDCSDYYLYLVQRLDKIILTYDPAKATFQTWFNVVLRSRYINWIKKRKKQEEKKVKAFLYNDLAKTEKENPEDLLFYHFRSVPSQHNNRPLSRVLNSLSFTDFMIVKLAFFPLDNEMLHDLSRYRGENVEKCFELYTKIIKEHSMAEKQNKIKDNIYRIQYDLFETKKRCPIQLEEEQKVSRVRQKRMEKALSRCKQKLYKNFHIIDMKGLVKILDLSKSEIYKRFANIKKILGKELQSFVTEGPSP
ncbi:MAG: hypothetical protein JW827_12500 [Spirochaetes bacterium]|nr:hypothetical protein [Spirochaetota bacterium]